MRLAQESGGEQDGCRRIDVSFLAETVMTRLLRRPTLFTLDGARMVRRRMHASNEKTVRELGLTLTPFEEVLKKAIRWFHEHGYIRKPIRVP